MSNPIKLLTDFRHAKITNNYSKMDEIQNLLCSENANEPDFQELISAVLSELGQSEDKDEQALFKKYVKFLFESNLLNTSLDILLTQAVHNPNFNLINFMRLAKQIRETKVPLSKFVKEIDIDEIIKLNIEAIPTLLPYQFSDEQTQKIFTYAISQDKRDSKSEKITKVQLIYALLDSGFKPPEEQKRHALIQAIGNNAFKVSDMLYKKQTILSPKESAQLLQDAISRNDVQKMSYLLKHNEGINLNADHLALIFKKRDNKMIKLLLQSQWDHHTEKKIHHAFIEKKEWDLILPYLLHKDLSLPHNRHTLESILKAVIKNKKFNLANQILQKGITLSQENAQALISYSISKNNRTILNYLLQNGAGQYIDENNMLDALQHAAPKTVECLIKHGWDEKQQKLLLMSALYAEKWNIVELLLSKGGQLTLEQGQQLLIRAIKNKKSRIVEWLLNHGVKPDFNRSIALFEALKTDKVSPKIVQMLLDTGADPKTKGMLLPVLSIDRYSETWDDHFLDVTAQLLTSFIHADQKKNLDEMIEQIRQNQLEVGVLRTAAIDWITASFSDSQKMAFELVLQTEKLRKLNEESAMEGALMNHAKKHFEEVVEPKLKNKFMNYPGNTEMEKVVEIEKEIKQFLLDHMLKTKIQVENQDAIELVMFIKENYEALIAGEDKAILETMRAKMTSNEDMAQIAWRGYDIDAPCDPGWPNLLTTPIGGEAQVFGGVSLKDASDILRKRIAYYFIAEPPVDAENFIGQLADIRRAHHHPRLDSPTCYPGGIGRISEMGRGHPYLALPPLPKDIIHLEMNKIVMNQFGETIKSWDKAQQQQLYLALTMLASGNAEDIVEEKAAYNESWLKLREAFIDSLGNDEEIKSMIKLAICEQLKLDQDSYTLSSYEENLINFELLDIGFGRNASLYDRIPQEIEQKIEIIPKLDINNPFSLAWGMLSRIPKGVLNRMTEKKLSQYIEFELIKKPCEAMLKNIDSDTIGIIIKELVDEAFAATEESPEEKINIACAIVFSQHPEISSMPENFQEELKLKIIKASTFTGISEKQEIVANQLFDRLKTNDNEIYNNLLDQSWNKILPTLVERTEQIYHNRKKLILSKDLRSASDRNVLTASQEVLSQEKEDKAKKRFQ